jgi:hypothetical protein
VGRLFCPLTPRRLLDLYQPIRWLTSEDIQALVAAFHGGTPKWKLADQYGISLSSVKRLLRKQRYEG